jgi:hypothetical protein
MEEKTPKQQAAIDKGELQGQAKKDLEIVQKQAAYDKDELLEAIETRLDNKKFGERIDRVENFLYFGNGDSLKGWMGIQETKLDGIVESVKDIPDLKIAVEKHLMLPHLWDYIKNPVKILVGIVILFVVLHTLSTYLPNFWNIIMIALGQPQLVIPLQ